VGYGINTDATDRVIPNSERQVECMNLALKKACVKPVEIGLINTHATSTPLGDKTECFDTMNSSIEYLEPKLKDL